MRAFICIVSCPNLFPNGSQSPPTENLISIVAFINIPIATHDDAIKGHVILVSALYRSLYIYPVTPTPPKIPSYED